MTSTSTLTAESMTSARRLISQRDLLDSLAEDDPRVIAAVIAQARRDGYLEGNYEQIYDSTIFTPCLVQLVVVGPDGDLDVGDLSDDPSEAYQGICVRDWCDALKDEALSEWQPREVGLAAKMVCDGYERAQCRLEVRAPLARIVERIRLFNDQLIPVDEPGRDHLDLRWRQFKLSRFHATHPSLTREEFEAAHEGVDPRYLYRMEALPYMQWYQRSKEANTDGNWQPAAHILEELRRMHEFSPGQEQQVWDLAVRRLGIHPAHQQLFVKALKPALREVLGEQMR